LKKTLNSRSSKKKIVSYAEISQNHRTTSIFTTFELKFMELNLWN